MSESKQDVTLPPELARESELPGWRGRLRRAENLLVVGPLVIMAVLPILEIVLRRFNTGISGSSAFVQHGTLLVGMFGGAIAARQGRLLSLSTFTTFLTGAWKSAATVFSRSVGATVTFALCLVCADFIGQERAAGSTIGQGIPTWIVMLVIPAGFAVIAVRLVWKSSEGWKGRLAVALATAAAMGFLLWVYRDPNAPPGAPEAPLDPAMLKWPLLLVLLAATLLGLPIYCVIGGLTLILNWAEEIPLASIPIKHYSLVTNPTLPTIPLFTMAGYLLAEGGTSKRLVRVFQALVGHVRGGPAILTALVCAFFTSFTGASGVTILALGGLLLPVLLAAGYSERNSVGLLTGAGSLGLLFPPCLPLILYAIVAGNIAAKMPMPDGAPYDITIEKMFLGGLGPGLLMVALTAALGVWQGPKESKARGRFDRRELGAAVWESKWELLLPFVALGALFSGWATPVEAAAVTALYAFVTEVFLYRDLTSAKHLSRVLTECGLLVGGVLLILGVAMGFTHHLVMMQVADHAVEWVQSRIESPAMFLLALNALLLVVGCVMDIFSAVVVVVPVIVPMAMAYGINPIHLGIIFLANLELGYLTPPVGMNLFLSAYRFDKPMGMVIRATVPMFFVLLVGVLLITYWPGLTTYLPGLLKK